MPDRVVVDASALAAVIFHEPKESEVLDALKSSEWFAPSLIDYEMASIARAKLLKHENLADEIRLAFNTFCRIQFQRVRVNYGEVVELALQKKLTTYDASYLWLSSTLKCQLLTLDAELAKAWEGK